MARMIPNIDPQIISNDGEKAFYTAAMKLPESYTVLYSLKYHEQNLDEETQGLKEADFVIVHPSLGYLVVEVKQGDIAYFNRMWCKYAKGNYYPLSKDPVEQAQKAMFNILKRYREKTQRSFPLNIRYAICFPECAKLSGEPPMDLNENSIFLYGDLENLEGKILNLFGIKEKTNQIEAVNILLDKILAPTFKVFSRLEDKMNMFYQQCERVFTEEQLRILEETELDKRKIFFGASPRPKPKALYREAFQ